MLREMKKLIIIFIVMLFITACGYKGALFLPENTTTEGNKE